MNGKTLPKTQFAEVPEGITLNSPEGFQHFMQIPPTTPLALSLEAKKGYLVIWDDRFYVHQVKEGGFKKRVLLGFGLLKK